MQLSHKEKERKMILAEEVRLKNQEMDRERREQIQRKMQEKQRMLEENERMRIKEAQMRKAAAELQHIDKVEAVQRLQKINEYQREKLRENIEVESMRVQQFKVDKNDLQQRKQALRKKAEIEKKTIMEGFSKLKAKGNGLNKTDLQKLAHQLHIPISVDTFNDTSAQ